MVKVPDVVSKVAGFRSKMADATAMFRLKMA